MIAYAGFNRLSKMIPMQQGSWVVTAGLANCIAVAAFDDTSMAIAHFDTGTCWDQPSHSFDVNTLIKWRLWLWGRTACESFEVGLGTVWYDTAHKQPANDAQRFDLINKLTYVFDFEPILAGKCIRFGMDDNGNLPKMEGSFNEAWVAHTNWKDEGAQIPYFELIG